MIMSLVCVCVWPVQLEDAACTWSATTRQDEIDMTDVTVFLRLVYFIWLCHYPCLWLVVRTQTKMYDRLSPMPCVIYSAVFDIFDQCLCYVIMEWVWQQGTLLAGRLGRTFPHRHNIAYRLGWNIVLKGSIQFHCVTWLAVDVTIECSYLPKLYMVITWNVYTHFQIHILLANWSQMVVLF